MTSPKSAGKPAPDEGEKKKKPTGKPENIQPKPKLSKAERRELQEKQRAAKAAAKGGQGSAPSAGQGGESKGEAKKKGSVSHIPPTLMQYDNKRKVEKDSKKEPFERPIAEKQVNLFAHLPQYEKGLDISVAVSDKKGIHPSVIALGLKYADGKILGSNARCVAMLTAFKHFVQDYVTPEEKILCRDLETKLKPQISYLVKMRPLSISMRNAINSVKLMISKIPPTMPENEAKESIIEQIDTFMAERIVVAEKMGLAKHGAQKIVDGDVILTFGCSHSVEVVIKAAMDQRKEFRIVIADARPRCEGKALLKRLAAAYPHLKITYVLLNGVSYIMKEVTKVFLGAMAMFSNGTLMARAGNASVANIAQAVNVPVIVCCGTIKFSERVQIDAFTHNELGDADELVGGTEAPDQCCLHSWREQEGLTLLNLTYDLTPREFITAVVTEIGVVPPTSVPVILREYLSQ